MLGSGVNFSEVVLRKLLHRLERGLAVVAAAALLIAQLGAMSHAYAHDTAVGSRSTHQTGASSHDSCAECLAYSPLLATAGAPTAPPSVEPQGRGWSIPATAGSLVDLSLTLAFRSRAPPATP
jgi:hypothetical protein